MITVGRTPLAAILVDQELTYPAPGAQVITEPPRHFPTLPMMLLSPRIGGISRSFALFDTTNIIKQINTDEIDWRPAVLPDESDQLPF